MVFSSITFIAFYLVVLCGMLVMQCSNIKSNIRQAFLLFASYFFYGWWDWRFCSLMLLITVVSYISSMKRDIKVWRVLGIVFPVAMLGVFKYFNFFIESFCNLFNIPNTGTINIILPVGISFYTFQALSYTIDVIQGKQKPTEFLKLALYIAFFPQLVAGPIVKAENFIPQLCENRKITLKNTEMGIQIFVFGLFKKIVLADRLSIFVDEIFRAPSAFNAPTLILAIISYSFQIYLDFSGYSDMAIGSAKILGYDFKPNFNIPYISKNLTEFWKRWHISLSSWLQRYLYFPLGGNRKGNVRMYFNLMATMILGGLWHGANETFVIWGALHGIGLCVHKFLLEHKKKKSVNGFFRNAICVLSTYVFVCLCWIFFRSQNFETAFIILSRIFTWKDGVSHMFFWSFIAAIFIGIGTLIGNGQGFYPILNLNTVKGLFFLFLAIGLTLALAYVGDNPFIYFQF